MDSPESARRARRVQWRRKARQGRLRVAGSAVPLVQAAVAAWLAYTVSLVVLGHQAPFLAPISAWICLGFTRNRVPRKVAELGAGATLGVLVGEVAVQLAGTGPVQVAVALLLAGLAARFLDRGDLFTFQAGVNAMVVVGMAALPPPAPGPFDRLTDAFVGALVALLFSVALPRDVTSRPRRLARSALQELGLVLGLVAAGVRAGDPRTLGDAYAQLSGIEEILDDTQTAVTSARDIARLNPTLRASRPQVDELHRVVALLRRSLASTEVLLRQSRGVIDEIGPVPEVGGLLDEAAAVLQSLAGAVGGSTRPVHARERATALAAACAPAGHLGENWRPAVLVSLMRSVTIDLLQLTGLSRAQARLVLPDTGEGTSADDGLGPDTDAPSGIWGERW